MKAIKTQIGGSYYTDMKIQPMVFAIENNLNPLQYNIIKRICRYKVKEGSKDLDKAKHEIDLLKELTLKNVK